MNKILLSFDLEEFDLPLEYGVKIPKQEQFEFSFRGLNKIQSLLEKHKIKATFFTTASFALKYPEVLKEMSKVHEIASHNLHHQVKEYKEEEVKSSKQIIEKIINNKIKGFRSPRLKKPDYDSLKKLGFKYSSSLSPTYLPKRYNNYFEKRGITLKKGVIEVPGSTLKIIRIPLSWIFFRGFGLNFSKVATFSCIKNPGYVNLFFHPWEFNNLNHLKIPFYIKKNSGEKALNMLRTYLLWCKKKKYEFERFDEFLDI